MSSFKYIPSFDGVRGIAVILVILLHVSYGFFKGGWIGVDLFFMLSGYLITSLLYSEYSSTGRISFKNFYIRRALRLFPPLILCILLSNILWRFDDTNAHASQTIATLASVFYLSNLVAWNYLGNLGQLWSLSVEEHFYFIWPIVFYKYVIGSPARKQLLLVTVLILLITLFRIYIGNLDKEVAYGIFVVDSYTFTFCRFDSILIGAALAIFLNNYKPTVTIRSSHIMLLSIAFIFVLFFVTNRNEYLFKGGFIVTNFLCLCLVYFAIIFPNQTVLTNSILRWAGRRSYGIYVYHFSIFSVLETFRLPKSPVNLLVVTVARIVLTIIITELSFRFIEQPVLKLKNKFKPREQASAVLK
jgi:peptidoglycan/LPS O-acetylase OafA/YrhL